MGRIVNNQPKQSGFINNDFKRDICLGRYVLVLGSDVILDENHGGGDSIKYIIDQCWNGLNINDRNNIQMGLANFKSYIRTMLSRNWVYDEDEISPDLIKLLKTKFFPVVLTTSFDGYVEHLMREIYGDELTVMNFSEENGGGGMRNASEYDIYAPTLYYVFGKVDENLKFAYTEDEYMDILCQWMGDRRPQGLINYLRKKRILAIGGRYENWYFRFFWHSLRQTLDLDQREGDVAISADNINAPELLNYLQQINVRNYDGSARDFLRQLSQSLCNPPAELLGAIHAAHYRNMGGVFISYAHEDYPIACQIYYKLINLGIPVWFDNDRLQGGAQYDERIANAIAQCRVFIPILSRQTKEDCQNNNQRYYNGTEWNLVLNNKQCVICPIALYGFDIRQDTHLLPAHFQNRTIIDWAKGGPDGLEKAMQQYFPNIHN